MSMEDIADRYRLHTAPAAKPTLKPRLLEPAETVEVGEDSIKVTEYAPVPSGEPMTRERLFALHTELCDKALSIMRAKNLDYTAGGNPFVNFKNAEVLGVPGELGLLIRVMDKMMRIQSFIRNGALAVKSEPVEDAIIDIMNYMILLAGMIEEKRASA